MAKRALMVCNPISRGVPDGDVLRAAAVAVPGWQIDIESTRAAGHAIELARAAAARGYDAVVACGGDGTVNEVANGVARSQTPLAVVRGGTANVWAKEIGVPKQPARALRLLASGETRAVDLGLAGERYFLLMAGVGFDAAIVRDLSSAAKRRFGAAAFVLSGLRRAIGYRAADAELVADGESLSGRLHWALLGNTRSYGGLLNIFDRARLDDGRLDLLLLREAGLGRLLWLLPFVLLHRHRSRAHLLAREVTSFNVATAGLPVQIDGEYLGETPLSFSVAPSALRVIVPPGLRSLLFSRDQP